MKIGKRDVGHGHPCLIVAELGLNHGGKLDTALEMVRAVAEAGADAVKVQAFSTHTFTTDRAQYKGESQVKLFERYELSAIAFSVIADECKRLNLLFFGTPDSIEQANMLLAFGAPCLKVGSDDLVHLPLLAELATLGVPLILSTGMADEAEIAEALLYTLAVPTILLHCVSEYPTQPIRANVARMQSLKDRFGQVVGYSDHTDGNAAALGAIWAGAHVIEKHFTLDRRESGPDHAFSADQRQLAALVHAARGVETMLGTGIIDPTEAEREMRVTARRSIVAPRAMKEGEEIKALAYKRPGDGLSPAWASKILGHRITRALAADEPFREGDWT